MDRVEKAAKALDDAIDNALIAWGMGWDMDGVMACLKEAKDAAALAVMEREATCANSAQVQAETQPQGFQMIAVPDQLRPL